MVKKLTLGLNWLSIGLAKFVKFSYILGSDLAFFSAVNIVAPVCGIIGGISNLVIYSILISIFKLLFFGLNPFITLLYHTTHIFASAYWKSKSNLFKVAIPLIAAAIFFIHPNGSFYYPLLWLVPVVGAFYKNNIVKALGATFTAHAIGSVIHLFTFGASTNWLAIIPVAILERVLFAMGIVAVVEVISMVKRSRIVLPKSIRI